MNIIPIGLLPLVNGVNFTKLCAPSDNLPANKKIAVHFYQHSDTLNLLQTAEFLPNLCCTTNLCAICQKPCAKKDSYLILQTNVDEIDLKSILPTFYKQLLDQYYFTKNYKATLYGN